jgi:predicted nucleic acid-binding protein
MKLPDLNALIGAVNKSSAEHERARGWLEEAFNASAGVGLAWVALLGFVRIATHRAILPNPCRRKRRSHPASHRTTLFPARTASAASWYRGKFNQRRPFRR